MAMGIRNKSNVKNCMIEAVSPADHTNFSDELSDYGVQMKIETKRWH